jgi:hypothetical protein
MIRRALVLTPFPTPLPYANGFGCVSVYFTEVATVRLRGLRPAGHPADKPQFAVHIGR